MTPVQLTHAQSTEVQSTHVQWLGRRPYVPVWQAMRDFTDRRDPATADRLWILEHEPVYTLGRAGRREHILGAGDIPIVESDRGGQVTYHGPGQLIIYILLDLPRLGLSVRDLVRGMEAGVIALCSDFGIDAQRHSGAPGVYVAGAKVAALGLRVRRGRTLHGLSLNVDMDLAPFRGINPCGYEGLEVTQLRDLGVRATPHSIAPLMVGQLRRSLGLPQSGDMQDCAKHEIVHTGL
jgi:lipoyl(octanoyl) transferase